MISLQRHLFGFENKGKDHAQQAVQYEKWDSSKLFKRKVWIQLGEFSNTPNIVFELSGLT